MTKVTTKKDSAAHTYVEGVGRRKTAIARVRLTKSGRGGLVINEKKFEVYFPLKKLQEEVLSPLKAFQLEDKYQVEARVQGGGVFAQAEAVRHGLSRALVKIDETMKPRLRLSGFLTRDSRMVERKKYGKKKARVSPQWSKR